MEKMDVNEQVQKNTPEDYYGTESWMFGPDNFPF